MKNNYKFFFKTIAALCLLAVNVFFSQSTSTTLNLDTTFNIGSGTFAYGMVSKQAVQSNGKIIIAGNFNSYGLTARAGIARINEDGTLDTSFNPGSGFVQPASITAIKIQQDGKILIGGFFTNYNGVSRTNIVRLNEDGSLDTTFNPGVGPNSPPTSIDIQSDKKILIVGAGISKYNNTNVNNVFRINEDGTLDSSFVTSAFGGSMSQPMINVTQVKVQPVGGVDKILVGGSFVTYGADTRNNIVRLESNGSIDTSFDAGTTLQGSVSGIETTAAGNVLLLGPKTNTQAGPVSLTNTGSLDTAFNPGGAGATIGGISAYPTSFLLKSNGKILITGVFDAYNGVTRNGIALLNADGTLDTAFDPGTGANATINSSVISADGGFLFSGSFTSYNGSSVKWYFKTNDAGALDTSFTANALPLSANAPSVVIKQPDDKLIIAGNFNLINGTVKNFIARLNTDGSIDNTFNNGGSGPSNIVQAVFLQPDGKILIGGSFTNYNGTSAGGVARLKSDGTLDSTFTPGTAFTVVMGQPATATSLSRLSTGKILVGGYNFTTYSGATITNKNLIQLNDDGTYDSAFNTSGVGVNNSSNTTSVNVIREQADGKILIGGGFSSFNGTSTNGFVRLNTNGSVDTTFTQGWVSGGAGLNAGASVRYILIQPSDNKIIIGGTFTAYNTAPRTNIARINTDGTVDTAFNAGTAGIIYQPLLLSDERLLVPGAFTSFNGTTINKLVRLKTDGTVDTSFTPGSTGAMGLFSPTGASRISFVYQQTDGNLLVLGNFNSYNNTSISIAARLIPVVTNNLATSNIAAPKFTLYPNPATDFVTLSNINKGAQVSLYDMTGKLLYATKAFGATVTLNTSAYQNGVYLVKVDGQTTKLLITK